MLTSLPFQADILDRQAHDITLEKLDGTVTCLDEFCSAKDAPHSMIQQISAKSNDPV